MGSRSIVSSGCLRLSPPSHSTIEHPLPPSERRVNSAAAVSCKTKIGGGARKKKKRRKKPLYHTHTVSTENTVREERETDARFAKLQPKVNFGFFGLIELGIFFVRSSRTLGNPQFVLIFFHLFDFGEFLAAVQCNFRLAAESASLAVS